MTVKKYPSKFEDASHALVLKTFRGDGWLFEGVVKIVRRPAGMIAIEGASGATFTFTIKEKNNRETGTISQARQGSATPQEFKVVPYNRMYNGEAH